MENPTLEQMEAWRDQATERLSLFARSNAIEEPIGIGEECYQLGEDCYKPDRYDQFRWVTEDQFDSVLPPGIEHDRYIAIRLRRRDQGMVRELERPRILA